MTDVSKDGGVMMKTSVEGEGWKKPKKNDIVHLRYKITLGAPSPLNVVALVWWQGPY